MLERHSGYASWALWADRGPDATPKAGVGDLSVFDQERHPDLLETLNPDVVFLGLNASSREMGSQPWANFHDPSPRANDFKIRYALAGTPFHGAYLTDVFVHHHETDSAEVKEHSRRQPEWVADQVARLEAELEDLGSESPLLVAFGGDAHAVVAKHLPRHRLVKVPHYSTYVSKEVYRSQVLGVLDAAGS